MEDQIVPQEDVMERFVKSVNTAFQEERNQFLQIELNYRKRLKLK